jgi:hypothetical protein
VKELFGENTTIKFVIINMGDIADDITIGKQCSYCGVMFEKPHGFPVQCIECDNEDLEDGFTPDVPRATEQEI